VVSVDAGGVSLSDGERIAGDVVLAASGVDAPAEPPRTVTLVTLVLAAPELDAAPRGTGVLVADGSGVGARALTHVTAKWPWVAESAGGRHVLRLSYDGRGATPAQALRDAETLLDTTFPAPDDAAVVTWERASRRTHAVDGMHRVGESLSGTGIAAVVAQADAITIDRTGDDTEPQG
jgi:oxygen-dependent protoporphyrinogen oxidase